MGLRVFGGMNVVMMPKISVARTPQSIVRTRNHRAPAKAIRRRVRELAGSATSQSVAK